MKIFFSVIIAISIIFLTSFFKEDFIYFVRSDGVQDQKEIIEKFNPSELKWREVTSSAKWSPRDTHTHVVFDDYLWVKAGLEGESGSDAYWEMNHLNDIWRTRDGYTWELVTSNAPWSKRRSPVSVVFNNKLWLIGGWNNDTYTTLNDVWNSSDGVNWDLVASSAEWSGREGHQVVSFNGKMFIFGGVDFNERKAKNDIWYSDDGINWNLGKEEASWSPRYAHKIVEFKGRLWLAGGLAPDQNEMSDMWYSDDGINWNLVTENHPWLGRHDPGLVVYKDKLWLIGGWNDSEIDSGLNDTWYSFNGIDWEKTNEDGPWTGREDHGVVVFRDKIWILGGMDSNWSWKNDVWVSDFSNNSIENSDDI